MSQSEQSPETGSNPPPSSISVENPRPVANSQTEAPGAVANPQLAEPQTVSNPQAAASCPASPDPPTGSSGSGPRLFIIAGDPSGDIHAGNMIVALRQFCPGAKIAGLGGPKMKKAGVKLLANIVEDLAIIGLAGVVKKFPKIRRLYLRTVEVLKTERPDALILVDYPGFNLRMAAEAKKLGIPVIYYIGPQVWAWRRGRIKTISELVAKMIVIFPFEEGLYRHAGMDVTYVGHPLLDLLLIDMDKSQVWKHFGFDMSKKLIGLVPGSRKSEIENMLPAMLGAAERLAERMPNVQFALPRADTISPEFLNRYLSKCRVPIQVADRYRYNLRASFDFAWVTSGTATLETALLLTPMIIVYQVNWLTWMVGKRFMTLACIGLPNIVAGDIVVPELLQDELTPQNLYSKTHHFLSHPEEIQQMRDALQIVKDKLGGPGASRMAALAILETLEKRKGKK